MVGRLEAIQKQAWVCTLHVIDKFWPVHGPNSFGIFRWSGQVGLHMGTLRIVWLVAELPHAPLVVVWSEIFTPSRASCGQLPQMGVLWHGLWGCCLGLQVWHVSIVLSLTAPTTNNHRHIPRVGPFSPLVAANQILYIRLIKICIS